MVDRTRTELLEALQASQQELVKLLSSMAVVQDWQPEPAEWSFRFIAAHLATVEQKCHLPRVKRIASGARPHLDQYANNPTDFGRRDLDESLQRWIETRQELLDFVAELSEEELTYVGLHDVIGPMTVLDTLEEVLDQDQGNRRHVYELIVAYYEETLE